MSFHDRNGNFQFDPHHSPVAVIGAGKALLISDNTGTSVLLLHFLYTGDMKANVFMQPTSAESDKIIHIKATH